MSTSYKLITVILIMSFVKPKTKLCKTAITVFTPEYNCIDPESGFISEGANARVWAVKRVDTKEKFILRTSELTKDEYTKHQEYMNRLKNIKNVVKCYKSYYLSSILYEILDYGEKGDLLAYIQNMDTMSHQRELVILFKKIINAVYHIHQQNIIHTDLKLENIVIDRHNNPLIIDFGSAVERNTLNSGRGTKVYIDPIILDNWGIRETKFTVNQDKWSLGVLLYVMVMKRMPFDEELDRMEIEEVLSVIQKRDIIFRKGVAQPVVEIILELLKINESERIGLLDLIELINRRLAEPSWEYLSSDYLMQIVDNHFKMTPPHAPYNMSAEKVDVITFVFSFLFILILVSICFFIYITQKKKEMSEMTSNLDDYGIEEIKE